MRHERGQTPPPARSEEAALDRARRRQRRMSELRDHWMAWLVCSGGLAAHCMHVIWFGEGSAREERLLRRELDRFGN